MNEAQKNAIREADNYLKAAGLPTYTDTILSRKEAQNQLYDARDRFEKEKIRILTTSHPAPEVSDAEIKRVWYACGVGTDYDVPPSEDDMRFARAILALRPQATPERHLTVTTNVQGDAVMVSWQDDEHRILEVVWERAEPNTAPLRLADLRNPGWCVGCNPDNCIGCGVGLSEIDPNN